MNKRLRCPLCTEPVDELLQSMHGTLCGLCFEVVDKMYRRFSFSYKWWEACGQ